MIEKEAALSLRPPITALWSRYAITKRSLSLSHTDRQAQFTGRTLDFGGEENRMLGDQALTLSYRVIFQPTSHPSISEVA